MEPLWEPDGERIRATLLDGFRRNAEQVARKPLPDYDALHAWSVDEPEAFWELVWEDSDVISATRGDRSLTNPGAMPGARFFPDARLNFAENLLRGPAEQDAIVFQPEGGPSVRLSFGELRDEVAAMTAFLRTQGVGRDDIVAGLLPNLPAAIVGMLASASIGAVWTSCSPDFGVRGIIDRFGQTRPKVLFYANGYLYKGRAIDGRTKAAQVIESLPSVDCAVEVEYPGLEIPSTPQSGAITWDAAISAHANATLEFASLPFNQALYVLYSSGTTGPPKCIHHGAGGTLLKHLAEHRLMCDIRPGDRVFYFTTCGWMMWNWLASALASQATVLLFDGNPMHPGPDALFDYASRESCTFFGTSAKYLDALAKESARPRDAYDLRSLRTVASTGSPLAPASFDYVYDAVHPDVCLSSISGGTDIVGCFVGGNPIGPVWRGEIQAPALGMAVSIVDPSGAAISEGKGELICTRPFPSMPIGFWGDADGSRYEAAYYERFPGVWHHGDYAEFTEHGGVIIHGRSDATLNPGGVRIGTAEIYRVVEAIDAIQEALVVGQERDGDVSVVLFVKLREGHELDEAMTTAIRGRIRSECTPRHVPDKILAITDIPRTRSGKIVELAVRDVINGKVPGNLEALANPEALEQFRDRPELA
ncbi:MAG: acetoacetate--CoA ligase [Acidobacteria bacterium]|nr:acetoacetate--CoA ligase [Acidobacteriota bacterium]